ncbi:MAG: spermidine/putrescine ABC transporter substrate-binding protein [Treponema sp.]|jgi:spermidine/putrescine-binding protein|nr:spermidine/putrescine ABC transporter substrate-binding protein [Treponema sp.]
MKMIKGTLLLVVLMGIVLPLSAQTRRQLVLYTWEEMFPASVLNGFKADYKRKNNVDIDIVYKNFEMNEDMLAELERTKGSGYDLVIADDYITEFVVQEGLAQRLNKTKLSNFRNINPFYQHQYYDPNDDYTVPYGAGVQTIIYNPAKVRKNITGYSDLWSNDLRLSVGLVGNYRVVNGIALKVLGKSYNTEVIADINAAGQRLLTLAPNILLLDDFSLDQELLSGAISVAVTYTDQVFRARQQNPNLKVVFPNEGIGFGIMAAFIPSRAANSDAAHAFLNYLLDAKVGAQCFEHLGYYCTFKASEAELNPRLKDLLILPNFNSFEMIENLTLEADDAHNQIWVQFLASIGR